MARGWRIIERGEPRIVLTLTETEADALIVMLEDAPPFEGEQLGALQRVYDSLEAAGMSASPASGR